MFQNKLIIFNAILVSSIPTLLISGPFLSDLAITITGITIFFFIIFNKQYKYILNTYSYVFFIFCIYLISSSLLSDYIFLSLEASLFYFRFGLFSIAIWYLLDNYANFKLYFFYGLLFAFFVLLADAYFQYFFDYNSLGWLRHNDRLSSFFGKEYVMGSFFSRLFPLLVALFLINFSNNKKIIFVSFIMLILIDIIIFLSGERVAFLNITLCTILIILFFNKFKLLRFLTFLISIIIIIFISLNDQSIKLRMIDRTYQDLFENENKLVSKSVNENDDTIQESFFEKFNIISPTHQKIYITSYSIFKNNIFFGTGPKSFREECKKIQYSYLNGCSSHPHNITFQFLSETGLVGFMFYVFLLVSISLYFFKKIYYKFIKRETKINNDYFTALVIALFVNLFPLFPSGNFFNNWISIIYFLPVGFILYYNKKNVIY